MKFAYFCRRQILKIFEKKNFGERWYPIGNLILRGVSEVNFFDWMPLNPTFRGLKVTHSQYTNDTDSECFIFGCVTFKPLKVRFRGIQSKNCTSKTPLKIKFPMGFKLSQKKISKIFKICPWQNWANFKARYLENVTSNYKFYFFPIKYHPLRYYIRPTVDFYFLLENIACRSGRSKHRTRSIIR